MTIAIVTDSTSDLSAELKRRYAVRSVPLYVLFDGVMNRDGLDLKTGDLFTGIRAGKKLPSTSQPNPAEFAAAYQEALQHADEVLSLHISGQLSGTVGSARLAAQDFGSQVTVLDSRSVSMGLGLRVVRAAEMAQAGCSVPEIVSALDLVAGQADIRFTVDTLDFLRLNGRIGGATALLGGLLNIKPILVVRGGRVEAGGRVRGQKKAIADLAEYARSFVQARGGARLAFMYTPGGEGYLQELRRGLEGADFDDFGDHEIGAVVATHAGPGTIGLVMEPRTV